MRKKIYRELTVDVMKFVFILSVVLLQILLINFLQVMEIVRTLGIHAFM